MDRKKQIFGLLLAAFALLAACTVEKDTSDTLGGGGNELQEARQEVLLTFKNKLAISGKETKTNRTTKADPTPLATAQENAVTSLDVYVFASDSETGNYTFQERLSYRAGGEELPSGSKELEVEAGSKENEFATLLKLQKGLFVKLYCIANQPLLVDPAGEGNVITDTYFQPLVQTTPGQAGSKVATEGIPSESLFQSFHTPFIASAGDTLVCPLPMSGAYTQPLDLTDYSVSSRMQVGFKLTRAVARFDIINNAALSRFTIDSIGMSNGRKGVTFFPIQAYGDQPTAQPDELITYPMRAFSGDKANTGTQPGAFYAYPSLASDETNLILKGRYKINETETKETSYPVAFKQTDSQGNGSFIEINPNHRYTVAITQADEQNLQVTIQTSDWADDGSIDEYTPGEGAGEVAVTIPDDFKNKSEWNADTRTLNLALEAGSSAGVSVSTNSAVVLSKRYSGKDQGYDWLEVSAPTVAQTKAFTAVGYQYTLSLKPGYDKGRYPKALLRFTDAATGKDYLFTVTPVWMAPANASGQLTSFMVNAGAYAEIRVSTSYPLGGISVSSSSGSVSYQSLDTNTGIITLKGNSAGSSTIKVYNSKDANKYISYSVTVKTIPSSSYITITNGGMTRTWAVGNLVAQGGSSCTIGSPTDKGLLFKWGSLVGYDATTSGNPSSPVVKPNAYSSSPSFTGSQEVTDANLPSSPSAVTAKGDPCRYYLGGSWRLPTADEYRNNLGGGVSGMGTFKVWEWVGSGTTGIKTGPAKQLFFPAAGYRKISDGSLVGAGAIGYVWSSSPYGSSSAYCLYFDSVGYANVGYSTRPFGFPVRCVQE